MSKNFRKHDILREQSTNKIVHVEEVDKSSMILVREYGGDNSIKRVHVSDLDFFPSAIISQFEKQWIDEKQFV